MSSSGPGGNSGGGKWTSNSGASNTGTGQGSGGPAAGGRGRDVAGGQRGPALAYMANVLGTMCHAVRGSTPAAALPPKMTAGEFTAATEFSRLGRRGLLAGIDAAFARYEAVGTLNPNNLQQALDSMVDLYVAANDYLSMDKEHDANRQEAVEKLRDQLDLELRLVQMLAAAKEARARDEHVEALKLVLLAQDLQVMLLERGYWRREMVSMDAFISSQLNVMNENPALKQLSVMNDIAALQALADDFRTPAITRRILQEEVLANLEKAVLTAGGAGMRWPNQKELNDSMFKYTVSHLLNAPGASPERLGSLAHELTHLAISETFENSALLLEIKPGATDAELIDLSNRRTQQLSQLLTTLENDSRFTADQRKLLEMKLKYPTDVQSDKRPGDIGRYIKMLDGSQKVEAYRDLALAAQLKRLSDANQINNSLVESGTVITQMLVYMAAWGIPQDDAFYTQLISVGTDAFQYREDYRQNKT